LILYFPLLLPALQQLHNLSHKKETIKVTSLRTLFVFIEKGPASYKGEGAQFDNDIFNRIVLIALCDGFDKDLMTAFKEEYVNKYDDVRYYLTRFVQKVFKV
jgi:hypothetical protein